MTGLGVHWSGVGADYLDKNGQLAAQDPTACTDGPSALLLREDLLREFLTKEKLTVVWAVLGEKRILGQALGLDERHASVRMSGAYVLSTKGPVGFLKRALDDPDDTSAQATRSPLDVIRTPE